ncbi:WD40 repeat-like protein [Cylindrobasidium torrendii FP15055 ss-10]|uniref:WD40 repeat-like protein n=1 Tax=Cylindrobasidium torrendii FP15055 ss-10 TaxID=1314674 RepID=A0A0D7BM37_9AGAR|nr:WD40 repeat-like protein [Cylindrobasidium torrendii FP15055 ss-10]
MPPKEEEENAPVPRAGSPPPHTTFSVRGVHIPNFSTFRPRDYRLPGSSAASHVAWSCDGKKLAAVGNDRTTRVWHAEKPIDVRSAMSFTGSASEVDYVAWHPIHPELFITSSQSDKRILFWDARQSKSTQQVSLKNPPAKISYSPDGRKILYTVVTSQLYFLDLALRAGNTKETWGHVETPILPVTTAVWNHSGDSLVVLRGAESQFRSVEYPKMTTQDSASAHVGGCTAVALDPRGRYVVTGGRDSILNIFDMTEWICARNITCTEYETNALSFSFDGEFIAIGSKGNYVDIVGTETAALVHRIPSSAPALSVAWHPSRYVLAYCGVKAKDGAPASANVPSMSMFGLME